MEIIDITQELFSCNVYPGDRKPSFERVKQLPEDNYQLTDFSLSSHNGTHIDAPLHFIAEGQAVDELDLSTFYGPCLVAEQLDAAAIAAAYCHEGRLLLKGKLEITPAIAQSVAQSKLRLLGVESQSVGPVDAPMEVHRILLGAGIVLLEGLDLSQALPGNYTLSAFPMKLGGCEGAPVRAVLIR
ncbi:MAG: cyclase family protein [Firmicutes bacterium]|nr:cyclase family protein [Bacillota bacterium]